jgi:hypothetical protein
LTSSITSHHEDGIIVVVVLVVFRVYLASQMADTCMLRITMAHFCPKSCRDKRRRRGGPTSTTSDVTMRLVSSSLVANDEKNDDLAKLIEKPNKSNENSRKQNDDLAKLTREANMDVTQECVFVVM